MKNLQKIPDLQVYTIKTPLIGRISIKTGFLGPQNRSIWGVPVHTNIQLDQNSLISWFKSQNWLLKSNEINGDALSNTTVAWLFLLVSLVEWEKNRAERRR